MRGSSRTALRKWIAALWPATIAGIVIGALLGSLALAAPDDHTATTVISIDKPIDVNQILTGTQPFPDAQPDYLEGEMVYLTSDGYVAAIAENLNQAESPAVTVAQSGKSNLFIITATASSLDQATKIADTAVKTYIAHVQEQMSGRYQSAVDAINAQIIPLETALRAADPGARVTDELAQLYLQRTSLEVQLKRAPAVQVVEPPMESVAKGALSGLLGTVGGALLGGFLALAGALVWRNRAGIIATPEQIDLPSAAVLTPILQVNGENIDAAAARSLYAQLPPPRSGEILVIGASTKSGTARVVQHLAFAAGEHGAVKVVSLLDEDRDATPGVDGTIIIDGGCLETSPTLLEAADHATQIVIVAQVGYDSRPAISTTAHAIAPEKIPVSVVCTRSGLLSTGR